MKDCKSFREFFYIFIIIIIARKKLYVCILHIHQLFLYLLRIKNKFFLFFFNSFLDSRGEGGEIAIYYSTFLDFYNNNNNCEEKCILHTYT